MGHGFCSNLGDSSVAKHISEAAEVDRQHNRGQIPVTMTWCLRFDTSEMWL